MLADASPVLHVLPRGAIPGPAGCDGILANFLEAHHRTDDGTDDGNWELHVMRRSSVGWMDTTLKHISTESE